MNTMYETPDFPYGQQSFTSVPQQRESTFALREEDSVEAPLEDEILELDGMFTLDGYQVVRREFFAHINEPSVTFNNCKFNVNSACLSKFPNVEYVQVLVNMDTKILALRPSTEHERDSFCWCTTPKGKRKPRAITCKLFFAKVVSLMGWNPDYRYKLLGKVIHANGEYLIAFDLTATEVYQRTFPEGQKPKTSKTPVFPAGWQNQFGMPFEEHRSSMQVNVFDGYAIYGLKENKQQEDTGESEAVAQETVPISISGGMPL